MNIKEGSRVLAIAESFRRDSNRSVLVGIVYRLDGIIDGIKIGFNTVGGKDSTENLYRLVRSMGREDINYILLSGVVISWFNIVDIDELYIRLKIPIIATTYEESSGLIPYLTKYFKDWEDRVLKYLALGERRPVNLSTGYRIYIRCIGTNFDVAAKVLDRLTLHGRFPEPIKIANMIARSILNDCPIQ